MRNNSIPFGELKRQYLDIKDQVDKAVTLVFNSGRFILGKNVEQFENEFAKYSGVKYGIGVGSGTEALHLALLAIDIKPGDEVITVPNTAVPTVCAIVLAQAKPIFVDINPETYCLDVNLLEKKITPKTKAIIPVHLYGHPVDMIPLSDLAVKYNIRVIEDACQAHGAKYNGKKVGSFGDAGCFSFYPSKNLGAYGDAGIVLTNNPEIEEKIRLLRNYGQEKRYYHVSRGINSRLDELQAAVLRVKLKYLDQWNNARRKRANLYIKLLSNNDSIILPREESYAVHVYHLFVIRVLERDRLREWLFKKGIETEIHYPIPIHLQLAYSYLGMKEDSFPIAEKYAKEIVSLPIYPELKESEIQYIAKSINEFYEKVS